MSTLETILLIGATSDFGALSLDGASPASMKARRTLLDSVDMAECPPCDDW
jgi:hypothetical protein